MEIRREAMEAMSEVCSVEFDVVILAVGLARVRFLGLPPRPLTLSLG